MGDPARQKQSGCGIRQIGRVLGLGRNMQQVARMVERHDDHHEAAQKINGVDTFHSVNIDNLSSSVIKVT